jgi:hypothetical protein
MDTAKRATRRLALIGWLALVGGAILPPLPARAETPPERVLPDSTVFLLKFNDIKNLRESFRASHLGQLWNDPAMKDFKDDLVQKIEDATKVLKDQVGFSLRELVDLPQGSIAVAALTRDDPKLPVAGALLADVGENRDKMADLLNRLTKHAEDAGAKVALEAFNGLTLHIVNFPHKDEEKPKDKEKDEDRSLPPPPVIWTQAEGRFFLGTDVEVVKDLTAHREGRDNALAANEAFAKTQAKTDAAKAQVVWFLDFAKVISLLIKASARGNDGQAQQSEVLVETLGLKGLKSAGGSFTLGTGNYDSLSKTFFLAPKPAHGLLKIFSFQPAALRPEPWVPANVASYQTLSWDFDNAYEAINEVVNNFQQGMLQLLEQQLVGPDGGQPLSFQKDFFAPLGNRITLVTDFKKPLREDSQRMLLGVALDDPRAFQNTVNRLFEVAKAAPRKREFQGTTIYDFDMPNLPQGPNGANVQLRPMSFAIAKDTLFLTTDTTLLEQVLRPGNAPLADNAGFQSMVREMPERVSGMSFVRRDESARLTYELVKTGQLDKAIQQAMGAQRAPRQQQLPPIGKALAVEKLPEFSALAKYLTATGGYSLMDDDGFLMTGFTLRRSGP